MARIDRAYVALALVLLIVGELLGFYMGARADNTWRSVHITIVLLGFVTLAIFGMLYRLWPAMKDGAVAGAQFWLTAVGVAVILGGSIQLTLNGSVLVIALGSGVTIIGSLLLAWLFWSRSAA